MRLAGIVLGVGLGGFVDGIILHQIMQWHNMGSAVLPPTTMDAMAQNMAWDSMFHAATLVVTLIGVLMLWSDGAAGLSSRRLSVLIGQMIWGWGLFNLVEGLMNHHLLNIHHVRDLPFHVPAFDWIFLVVGGVGFSVIGLSSHGLVKPSHDAHDYIVPFARHRPGSHNLPYSPRPLTSGVRG